MCWTVDSTLTPSHGKPGACGQADEYVANGYLVVPDLLTLFEVEQLRGDLLKTARGGYPCQALPTAHTSISDEATLASFLCIHHPQALSPIVRAYMSHPRIVDVLGRIVGAHLGLQWDGSVKCMQTVLFAKAPGKPGQAWHQDEAYIPTRDRSLCGAWIALDDATVENGCLWVVPGSHTKGVLYPVRRHGAREYDASPEAYGFDPSGKVPVEVRAGGVVFFNGYLLHGSQPNTSKSYRRSLVSHYMTGQSLLGWEVKPNGPHGLADNRRVAFVAGKDPYPWEPTQGFDERQVHLRAEAAAESSRTHERQSECT